MEKPVYTVKEILREIGIGRAKLYQEINAGKLKPRKLGKRTLFLRKDVEAYLESLPEYKA